MARLRTFIAVDVGKPIRDRAVALQGTLARSGTEVKWVEPENIHVTLHFLGEVDDRVVPEVCKVVAASVAQVPAFALTVERTGCFPNLRRPRIVWIGIGQGTQELVALHDRIEEPLLDLGCYRREERAYTPHITLGRVKSDRPTDKLTAALNQQAGWKGGETVVNEVLVMSSELTPQGPRYTVLSRAKLHAE
jgi:2'-5' RNA ligase